MPVKLSDLQSIPGLEKNEMPSIRFIVRQFLANRVVVATYGFKTPKLPTVLVILDTAEVNLGPKPSRFDVREGDSWWC